jgi:multimeric flavodoxin WrbA
MPMARLIAVYGSPRRNGNTATLLRAAVDGARENGAAVEEIVLRDLNLSPCLEIYGCKNAGKCAINDDFTRLRDRLLSAGGLMLASPIFFYTVSAHTKIFMDRFQSLWVKKYWVDDPQPKPDTAPRKGLFIAAGATKGKKLFDGTLLTVRYFFDVLDMELWDSLLLRGLDHAGDVLHHPEYIQAARLAGAGLSAAVDHP